MYERNAILIDRYFANLFGYDQTNNLKNNSNNYFELVEKLENYQVASETENNIMTEFENVANRIRETQKLQEVLNKRNLKYSETRKGLFENLDEDEESLVKKFAKVEEEINKNNEEIKANTEKFIQEIKEFNEKTETRTNVGRERKEIEGEYQKTLNYTENNFSKIDREKLKEIKNYIKTETKESKQEKMKERILKNGAKEKVPFDINAITKAVDTSIDIEEKKVEVLLSVFDKTMKLLDEVKNDTVKIEKHKKIVKDSKSKLEFLNVISEYIILFLDNERMNTRSGEEEHQKIMKEACTHLQSDLIQIQNMYSLLIKEITGKSSKKAYKDLYNLEYLFDLQDDEKKFEQSISKLNMIGTVIYPDYWRIEGMQKIYDTFKNIMTESYEKDLSEFEPLDITWDVKEDVLEEQEKSEENNDENSENIQDNEEIKNENEDNTSNDEANNSDDFIWEDTDEDDELDFGGNNNSSEEDDEDEDENDYDTTDSESEEYEEDELEEEIEPDEEIEDDEELEDTAKSFYAETDDEFKNEEPDELDEEEKMDKEIDEILGLFDNEDDDETAEQEDEEKNEIELELDETEEEKEQENTKKKEKEHKKKAGLFGRRKK